MTEETNLTTNTTTENSLTLMEDLNRNSKEIYCSLSMDTVEDKQTIFNALGECDYRLSDKLNTTIALKDVIIQKYSSYNQETGEVTDKFRTVLIASNGETYASASKGLYNSVKKLFAIMGMPDSWAEPINIQVVETKTKQGFKTFEIKLV